MGAANDVAFNVPVAEFLTGAQAERQLDLRRMGPDLLGEAFDEDEARRRILARPTEEIGEVLLNQRVLAGAGNVFKSEILFMARVHPFRRVSSLTTEEVDEVLRISRKLLLANVAAKKGDGIVTSFGSRRTTGRADRSQRLYVYSRGGEPCRKCGAPIAFDRQGDNARVTYWCPLCQPEAASPFSSPLLRQQAMATPPGLRAKPTGSSPMAPAGGGCRRRQRWLDRPEGHHAARRCRGFPRRCGAFIGPAVDRPVGQKTGHWRP